MPTTSGRLGRVAPNPKLQDEFGEAASAAGRTPRTILVNITLLVLGLVLLGIGII